MGLARHLLLRGSESRWLGERLAHRPFVHRAVRRFMPGEELEGAVEAARGLASSNLATILTLLGENVSSAEETVGVATAYGHALQAIGAAGLDTDLSVKATHLGLNLGQQLAFDNLDRVIADADEAGRLVALDMEATGYVDRTLDLYRSLRTRHSNVGICLQAYLYRTEADLDSVLSLGPMVRLVKGAYNEPADAAFPRKSDVDLNYLLLADQLLEARQSDPRVRIAFGTHDERMIDSIIGRMDDMGLPPGACEFQMLYGIGRKLQLRLVAAGHPVRVLISYGSHWFPWYMRRLAERPANVGFVLRSLVRN
jgi:proline dehydrogenase